MKKTQTSIEEIVGDYSMAGARRMDAPGNLRAGHQTRGVRSSHLEAEENAEETLQKIAVAYVRTGGKVLAISGGKNSEDFNMPGGHVEIGEDPQDAAVRELWEETGLKADELFPIFSSVRGGYLVTVYKVTSYHGKLRPSEEGVPTWESPEVLMNSTHGDLFRDLIASGKVALTESRRSY